MSNGFTDEQYLRRNAELLMELEDCKEEIRNILSILKDKNYINNKTKIKRKLSNLLKKMEGVNT